MPAIKLTTPASLAMQAYLQRDITLAMVRDLAETRVIAQPRTGWIGEVDGGVQSMANRKNPAEAWAATSPVARPVMQFDGAIGSNTLVFDNARDRNMAFSQNFDFSLPWSMLAVFRYGMTPPFSMNIIGNESSLTPIRTSLQITVFNRCRVFCGSGQAQATGDPLVPGQWYAAIAGFNGSNRIRLWMPGRDLITETVDTPPTSTPGPLRLSDTDFPFAGAIDLGAYFTSDLLDESNATPFGLVRDMLKSVYGAAIDGN